MIPLGCKITKHCKACGERIFLNELADEMLYCKECKDEIIHGVIEAPKTFQGSGRRVIRSTKSL